MIKREFPFVEVSAEARRIVGEPTPGTRMYRREGSHEECGEWFEAIGKLFDGDVGLSPGGVTMYVPVTRAAVSKRLKEGRLTGFAFYITSQEKSFLGKIRKIKQRPYMVLSVSECKAWAEEMKRRLGYEDEAGVAAKDAILRRNPAARSLEHPSPSEEVEADEFVQKDPKDAGDKGVVYKEPMSRDELIELIQFIARTAVEEALGKLLRGKLGEKYRRRAKDGCLTHERKTKKWKSKD